jgi:hypothetical protein
MKKIFILLFAIAIAFTSCIKAYDEGPFISFNTTKSLLLKRWVVDQLLVDNVDSTKFYYDSCGCDLTFENREDNPDLRLNNCIDTGFVGLACRFVYDRKKIQFKNDYKITFLPFISGSDCIFMRLSSEDCWLETTINGKNYYVKLKAK